MSAAGTAMNAAAGDGYYQAVEEFFVSRRGDPLFLSSADWVLVHRWRTQGLPLRVVLRGIADALDSHALSWSRDRKVGSLRYCEAEVEVARERWQRALALGQEEGLDVGRALEGFADALASATGLGPAATTAAAEIAREIRERSAAEGAGGAALEEWLSARERQLLAAIGGDCGQEGRAQVEAEVDRALQPYAGRMPERVLRQVREDGIARRLLEAHGLPRLSLVLLAGG
jgi:hypothetical protein